MLEDEIVSCPICGNELYVNIIRISRMAKNVEYLVPNNCPKCNTPKEKIEKSLNSKSKRSKISTEKSYIKTDPRG